jgi:hypothetical protein
MPSPGGQINRMGACHPDDLPEGYHTVARGQSLTRSAAVASRAAHERPRGRAVPGRRDGTSKRGEGRQGSGCDQICDQDAAEAPGIGRPG